MKFTGVPLDTLKGRGGNECSSCRSRGVNNQFKKGEADKLRQYFVRIGNRATLGQITTHSWKFNGTTPS